MPNTIRRPFGNADLLTNPMNRPPIAASGINSASDMRAALNTGHIELAFASTVLPSKDISKIAKDGNCILLGLNNDRDAILQENPHLVSVDFQQNSYVDGDFCRKQLKSIGARRVIICSNLMSDKAAYAFGMRSFYALRDRMPKIEWETLPPRVQRTSPTPLRYTVHPGAKLIQSQQPPPGQNQWWQAVVATALLWGLAELAKFLNSIFLPARTTSQLHTETEAQEGTEAADPERNAEAYGRLKQELELQVRELERASMPLSGQEYKDWGRKIDELRERVLATDQAGSLNAEQTHILLEGIRQELKYEHELRKSPKRRKASDIASASSSSEGRMVG